jgi:hypothetical protein
VFYRDGNGHVGLCNGYDTRRLVLGLQVTLDLNGDVALRFGLRPFNLNRYVPLRLRPFNLDCYVPLWHFHFGLGVVVAMRLRGPFNVDLDVALRLCDLEVPHVIVLHRSR